MFLKIAPDSVIGKSCATGGYPRSRWIPLVMLVWTFWIFANPSISGDKHWLWATLASLVVFLPLYFRAYYGPGAQVLWCALGMAALGFALTPVNVGAQGYLIYASAFLAFTGRGSATALQRMLLLNLLYALECRLLGMPWSYVLSVVLIGMAIGGMNLLFRRNQQHDAELRLSHDEIRRLAATAERERIGRDLHDLLGHTLSLVALKSELAGKLLDRDPSAARREIAEVERVARDALGQVRSAVTGIRAAGLAGELASARLLLESAGVHFDYRSDDRVLDAAVETCMAMALREAATNIQRHARATHAAVEITNADDRVAMLVRDDGRGGVGAHGNGLSGMRERIEALGGTLSIESTRGHGTQLRIALPVPVSARAQSQPRTQNDAQDVETPSLIATELRHA